VELGSDYIIAYFNIFGHCLLLNPFPLPKYQKEYQKKYYQNKKNN
jgi:hypothetical protein